MALAFVLTGFTPVAVDGSPADWADPEESHSLVSGMRDFFEGSEVRLPGSPGNLAVEEKVARTFAATGLEHGEIRFRAPCFTPGAARLYRDSAPPLTLHPLHPTLFRPGNFAEKAFETELVDMGNATAADLLRIKGVSLRDRIVLVNMAAPGQWRNLMRFGVRGFVFVGDDDMRGNLAARSLVHSSEVGIPRFYVNSEDGEALRAAVSEAGGSLPIRVESDPSRWQNRMLRDLWVLVPGTDEELARDIVVLTAPMDSNCVVPGLAVGAQSGANLHLLTQLLHEFAAQPPRRSVLLVAVNAHTQNHRGERLLAWNLLAPLSKVEGLNNTISDELRMQELYLKYLSTPRAEGEPGLYMDDAHREQDEACLVKLRDLRDKSLGFFVTVKEPLVSLANRDVNRLRGEQLALFRRKTDDAAEKSAIQDRRNALERERRKYVRVLTLFNRFGGSRTTLGDLYEKSPESVGILRGYVKELKDRYRAWADMNRADLDINSANAAIRGILENRRVACVVSLDMDWSSALVGFSSDDPWGNGKWQTKFGLNTVRIAEELAGVREGLPNLLADTMTARGGVLEGYHFPTALKGPGIFHVAGATPAFSLRNVATECGRAFLPGDTFEALDSRRVAGTMRFVQAFLRAALEDAHLTQPSELPSFEERPSDWSPIWSVCVKTMRFDDFSASVLPTMPIEKTAIMLYGSGEVPAVQADGVVTAFSALTDGRAVATVHGIHVWQQSLLSLAHRYDEDFTQVLLTIDAGSKHASVPSDIPAQSSAVFFPMFPCKEIPLYVHEDPSTVGSAGITVSSYHLLDGETDSAPDRYGTAGIVGVISTKKLVSGMVGPAAVYRDERDRLKILTAGKRGGINASADKPEGKGYGSLEELGPDFFAAAVRDMEQLNAYRVGELRGVSDELVRDFQRKGREALDEMAAHEKAGDLLGVLRSLYRALGAEAKAYEQTTAVTNDMLKAVVFYMALLIPFCFFFQRLVFKMVKVEYQMGMFVLIFVATFIVFRFIHPAFRIARAPEAMFIAFVMGMLGFFVIHVLHSRFEGEMQLLFQTYTGMDVAEVRYSTAGQQAMLIGVNNMKRRRVRTVLTTATIVLVTFTMLAFTSISKKVSPTMIGRSVEPSYTGLMYHWPGQPMDEATRDVMVNLFAGRADIVERHWLQAATMGSGVTAKMLPLEVRVEPSGKTAQAEAVLGLPASEDGFLDRVPLLPGGRFFSSDDADEAIVPAGMADALGISPAVLASAELVFRGQSLKVVGILDDERFLAMRDIDNRPLVPLRPGEKLISTDDAEAVMAEDAEAGGVRYVGMGSLFLLPVARLHQFAGASPYSLSIRFRDDEQVWPYVEEVLTATRAKLHVSSMVPFRVGEEGGRSVDPGVFYVGSGYRTSVGGLSVLIIPLLIASTIILNTMLGSVYERRSEIAVYNAVGLNPTHIGIFFLAEAFVYSVIGSVGGYLLGQVLSIGLNKFGLVSDINLNFSSLSVVYVILFTISIVLLSTIYPAYVATKAAVPSGKRKWSMPSHDGNRMHVAFPFIYRERLLPGIMNYLQSYFSRFTEASMGELVATPLDQSFGMEDGRPVYRLRYHLSLPPYDLGVTQHATFVGRYEDTVSAHC
ncbi:MAG: FtsX-like permease family protein, partial [Lentisphaerae bacterium]|nr:FtsX-like permease family protein [Lentisphaerota bacterium]